MKPPVIFALGLALSLLVIPTSAFAVFGLTSSGGYFVVDTGAGLVFKVNQANGDINSLIYNGVEYQYSAKGSHINSGLGSTGVTVAGTTVGTDFIKITVTAPAAAAGGTLTHYYLARKGFSHVYMATHFTQEPDIGLVRFIVRIPNGLLPNGPTPSDIRNNTGAIESADIFGMADGTTRSKHYSGQRLKDWSHVGATGPNVAAWMVRGHHEGGSSGPFYRCLINQCGDQQELYEIINYGEAQTEPFRFNILNGPYTLVFTNGGPPPALDLSWVGDLGLTGYVAPAGRGGVTGAGITGRDTGYAYTVGFANATAQYWTDAAATDGAFSKSDLLPGTYTMRVYKNELAVHTDTVTITAGGTLTLPPIAITGDPSATVPLWRVGNWDGSPAEFLNGDKVTSMHPADVRMAPWGPGTYVVGTSTPATGMPCYQWKDVAGGSQPVQFNLSAGQIAATTVRVGITCAHAGGRPNIAVNSWTAGLQSASTQPTSRTLTVGTYRGNNVTYTFNVPASALVVGTNTLYLYPISGSSSAAPFLSPGYSLDCVELYQGTAQTLAVPAAPSAVTTSGGDTQVALQWSAVSGARTYNVLRANVSGGPYVPITTGLTATNFTDTGLVNATTYFYVVTAGNSSGTSLPSDEVAGTAVPPGPPAAPAGLSATAYHMSAALSWTASFGATSYRVKRSTTVGSGYVTVKTVAGTTYSDFGLANGTTYHYVVSAVNTPGEGPDSAPVSVTPSSGTTVTLPPTASLDGYVTAATSANVAGGTVTATGTVRTGDSGGNTNSRNRQYRGIFSFDTSPIPDDAVIQSATLKLKRAGLSGTSPFTALGACSVDLESGTGFNASPTLEAADFQAAADATQVATMTNAASNGAVSTGNLSATGLGLLNRTGPTQFRVAFATATNNNNTADYVSWYAGDDATDANRPALEVTYAVGTAPSSLPVAHLAFDETAGTVAADVTGNNWAGTLVNGPARVAGRVNGAVNLLVANSQHVTLPAGVVATLNDATLSAWVNLAAVTNWTRLFDFGTGMTNYLFLTPTNNLTNRVRFAIRTPAVAEQIIEGTGPLPAGTWTHVAVTLSGATGKLYVNGTLAGTNAAMTLKPSSLGNTTLNYLGRSRFAADPYLQGAVDEFQVYNHALTASEVALLAAPPAAPAGLSAAAGDGQVTLGWNPVPGTVTGYNVKRATAGDGPYTTIASGVPGPGYTDAGLVNGTTYHYLVSALNGIAEGPHPAPVSVTPLGAATNLTGTTFNGAVTLSWQAAPGATGYHVKRSANGSGGPYATIAQAVPDTSYRDETAASGTTYHYVVSATNSSGESAASAPAAVVASPTAPTGLAAQPGNAAVTLTWNAPAGAATFSVLRSETNNTGYSELASGLTSPTYHDAAVANGVTYFYVVSAANPGGESAWSTPPARATPASPPIRPSELLAPELTLHNDHTAATCTVRASVPGHTYRLQRCADLVAGAWTDLGAPQAGHGGDLRFTVPVDPLEPHGFFRVAVSR